MRSCSQVEALENREPRTTATHFEFAYALMVWVRQIQYHCGYYKFAVQNGLVTKPTAARHALVAEPAESFPVLAQQVIMTSPKFAETLSWNNARLAVRHRLAHRGCQHVSQVLKEALVALKEQGLCKEPDNSDTWKNVCRTSGTIIRDSKQMTVARPLLGFLSWFSHVRSLCVAF